MFLGISSRRWPNFVALVCFLLPQRSARSAVMAQLITAIMAGLLFLVESEASDVAHRSALQGFLSKYMLAGSDAPSSMSDYDKFITPNLNRVKHGSGAEALSSHKNPVELGPNMGVSPFTIVDDKTKDRVDVCLAKHASLEMLISSMAVL